MQELTRQQYIENIDNYEKLYLLVTETDRIYLRADIEDAENLRIEMLYFALDTSLKILDAEQKCRGNYLGKINFIEYETGEIAAQNILDDFLNLADDAIFLLYENDNLKNILTKYPNKNIFLRI